MKRRTLLWAAGGLTTPPALALPYTLEDTDVVTVPAPALKRAYELYVSLPPGYAEGTQRYPVLYVTDAPYAFPLIRAIAGRVDRHGVGLAPFILVGLGYAKGDSGVVSRNRDYTPTARTPGRGEPDTVYGQSLAYLAHLADTAIPLVDARWRTDPKRRLYAGHSYGGLLGIQALLERPGLFSDFILGSPSLWFDKGQPFEAEQRHAKARRRLAARVRLYVGGLEIPSKARPNAKDMVGDARRFVTQLRTRRHPGLDVALTVLDGEDHATVFPRLITQGLMWALPKPR
ncbi:MAG: alpha/beta hydrolase [Proteobacteria bacterium]|nr:alpha/beta hydrolase [Pseudomonadota bacterium]